MKQKISIILLVTFFLAGCGTNILPSPTPLPTVSLDTTSVAPQAAQTTTVGGVTTSGGVTASGVVVPAQQAQLSSTSGGRVMKIDAVVGDLVKTDQTLVELEGQESLQAAVSAAQLELDQAQQALADLTTQAETDRIQALQDIVTYAQAEKDAQIAVDNYLVPSDQSKMSAIDAYNLMKKRLDAARTAYEPYKYYPKKDPGRKIHEDELNNAQGDYNIAVKRLRIEYNLDAAQARLTQAQNDYEKVKSGPDPDKVRLAEARQTNAKSQLAAAQAALKGLLITAPFDGTISRINYQIGEWVMPGQVILVIADFSHMHIETTDLSERDVPQVKVGQQVSVQVKALNQKIVGHVTEISPLADTLGGDVIYKTTIDLDQSPTGLLAGMSVDVQFGTGGNN